MGTITDILSAIRFNVYDNAHFTMRELLAALRANFAGHETLRQRVLNRTPKFGNDDDYADGLMTRVFEAYFEAVDGRPTPRGGSYRINLLPTTAHIYFGKMTGATADGRLAGDAVSEGVSPVQGADRKGPTAVIKSLGKMDHVRTGGTLLNQKFTPQLLADETGIRGLKDLVRSYFKLDGPPHPVQRRHGRYPAGSPGPAGEVPRSDRPGRGLQRLLRRLLDRAPERDHPPHRAPGALRPKFLSAALLGNRL